MNFKKLSNVKVLVMVVVLLVGILLGYFVFNK